MADHHDPRADRLDDLERRVAALEEQSVSRRAFDEEIRSLERRLGEVREAEG